MASGERGKDQGDPPSLGSGVTGRSQVTGDSKSERQKSEPGGRARRAFLFLGKRLWIGTIYESD